MMDLPPSKISVTSLDVMASFAEQNNVIIRGSDTDQEHEFHYVREQITSNPFMYLVSKDSFYHSAINDILTSLLESGVLGSNQHLRFDLWTTNGRWRPSPTGIGEKACRLFSMADLRVTFISLGLGLGTGVGVLILELYCSN